MTGNFTQDTAGERQVSDGLCQEREQNPSHTTKVIKRSVDSDNFEVKLRKPHKAQCNCSARGVANNDLGLEIKRSQTAQ